MVTVRPICARCSRAARTVDTPRVKVRVDSAVVSRDAEGLRMVYRCHGKHGVAFLSEDASETTLEATEVFLGDE